MSERMRPTGTSEAPLAATCRRLLGEYGLALGICLALLTVLYDLPNLDWNAPLRYQGDSLFYGLIARGLYEHGWHLTNPDVGAPFGLEMHDFPIGETWHFLLMKILCGVLPSAFAVFNVYFFLTFPLSALTSLIVLRHFGIAYWPALVCSVLYAFLPYHALRGTGHIFLACYYLVPLGIMAALWIWQGEALLLARAADGKLRLVGRKKTVAALIMVTLIGLSNVYYIYFTGFLLALAGLARSLGQRSFVPCAQGLMLIVVLGCSSVANMLPNLLYIHEHGHNPQAVQRFANEKAGLRIAQLVLPMANHRLRYFVHLKDEFNYSLTAVDAREWAALGLVGSFGFLVLLFRLLTPARPGDVLWSALSRLNVFCLLLGTIGGFGLIVKSVFPFIRDYSRISVFIGFFSLFAVALILDALAKRLAARRYGRGLGIAGACCLLVAGVFDQSPRGMAPSRDFPGPSETAAAFHRDERFVRRIEATIPAGAAIFLMPYVPFPEGGSYEQLRLYLHATQTRWSYPTMRGRAADAWHKELSQLAFGELLPRLRQAGFAGVCLDRQLLGDSAASDLERKLAEIASCPPLICEQQRFVFFSLAEQRL